MTLLVLILLVLFCFHKGLREVTKLTRYPEKVLLSLVKSFGSELTTYEALRDALKPHRGAVYAE